MKSVSRFALTGLLILVIAFSVSMLITEEAQAARAEYTCCKLIIRIHGHTIVSYGVWIDGQCHCNPAENPRRCATFCNPL